MDGPDNWGTYMTKNEMIQRDKRQSDGGGIMYYGMLFPSGILSLKKFTGTVNSTVYKDMLQQFAFPLMMDLMGDDFLLTKDNCSVHKSKQIADFMEKRGIETIEWPSRSPDLNIIENAFVMVAEKVYDGPQPKNKVELEQIIDDEVKSININDSEKLKSLYNSIPKRICTVLSKSGQKINY